MVLGADEALDLALLSVPGLKAPPLPLGATVETGDTVYAVGYPAGLAGEASVTQGIISAQRTEGDYGAAYLQTDAPINPGNSGGPLFNTRARSSGSMWQCSVGMLASSKEWVLRCPLWTSTVCSRP